MYFRGRISIDPSHATELGKTVPTKVFGRMLHYLTFGSATPWEERETFAAISILQSLNRCFRRLGVTDLVRLAKDDVDFYLDSEGRRDDLAAAMDAFASAHAGESQAGFESLRLVLEHDLDPDFGYLIEVSVRRCHPYGEHPIGIKIQGALKEFAAPLDGEARVKASLEARFGDQDAYEDHLAELETKFRKFMDRVEDELRRELAVDEIALRVDRCVVRPREERRTRVAAGDADPEFFVDYHGWDDYACYLDLWPGFLVEKSFNFHDAFIVDEIGRDVLQVGETGFDAGGERTLDPSVPFELPSTGDFETFGGSHFDSAMPTVDPIDAGTSSSWLDGFGGDGLDAGGFDGGSFDGGGCGGGCGGD